MGGTTETDRLRRAFVWGLSLAAILWVIKGIELASGLDLAPYGIFPRTPGGLLGILWAPLIHASVAHLFANTAPLVVLLTALLYGYPRSAVVVIPAVYLGGGLLVWLFARPAYHIGASGLTFGLMSFVFTLGLLRRDRRAIGLSLLVFFLYGGMITGLVPMDPRISFESHLFGALTGIVLAFVLRRRDPPPAEPHYDWEDEPDAESGPTNPEVNEPRAPHHCAPVPQ